MQEFFWYNFLHKEYLWFWILVFLVIFWYFYISKKNSIYINFFDDLKNKYQKFNYLFFLRLFLIIWIFLIFIVILADPQKINVKENIKKNWIDIVLALDVSKSMDANDLSPTRIEKAKQLIIDFLTKQKTNRVWLVIFSWQPISSIPLTFDYNILISTIKNITTDSIKQDFNLFSWTAVWDALLIWQKMFKDKNREKVIILLTDWDSNKWVNPVLVSEDILKNQKIKVYTIWIWSKSWWYISYKTAFFNRLAKIPPLNEKTLRKISKITSAEFFRASDDKTFEKIFKKLESLEKNEISVKTIKINSWDYKKFFYILLILISSLFVLELRKN